MHVEPRLRDDVVGVIEFGGLREMGDIAGVDDEGWLHGQGLDLVDRLLERAACVGIGGLVETHVAVADLQECQPHGCRRHRFTYDSDRTRQTTRDSP